VPVRIREGHAVKRNGGYRSVTRTNAYAMTRSCHRITPSTKSNIRPRVTTGERDGDHATIITTTAVVHRNASTTLWGIAEYPKVPYAAGPRAHE